MFFFKEFINITSLHDSLAIFLDVVVFSSLLDEVDGFSTLQLEEELVTRIRKEEIQIDSSGDSFASKVGRFVSLAVKLTIAGSLLISFAF
jgi:hypothetical protein